MFQFDSDFMRGLDSSRIYWSATREVFDERFKEIAKKTNKKRAGIDILTELTKITQQSKDGVKKIQNERVEKGEIENVSQSDKAIVGNNYQALIGYALEVNRLLGNIPGDLKIALKPRRHPIVEEYATIEVFEEETQKPDVDLLIYKEDSSPIIIISCKTSLRERAGQTYKWKLLMDITQCECEHETTCPLNNYDFNYETKRPVFVGFITADFYDEIHSAQHRGMFTFFDYVYVTKGIEEFNNVQSFKSIISDLNKTY